MKTAFIINPASGRGRQNGIEAVIPEFFDDFSVDFTERQGDATRLAIEAIDKGCDRIVAVGGDGTLNECVKALVDTNATLAVIPCGSGNGFANHIKMSKNIRIALDQISKSQSFLVDTGEVNGEVFVNVSGVGYDAYLAKLFNTLTDRGMANYVRLVVSELAYEPKKYTIRHKGGEREIEAYMITCCNATQFGNDARICPTADISDGLLDFVIVKKFPQLQIPEFILRLMSGTLPSSGLTERIQDSEMEIIAEDSLVHIDGEPFPAPNPIRYKVKPKSLRVSVPTK